MMSRMPSAAGALAGAVGCRGCGEVAATAVLDLGEVPASDYFPPLDDPGLDPRWPLQLYACAECALVQLGPSEHLEPEPPLAVESATALAHAARSAADIVAKEGVPPGATVIEIDSHHGGSWLAGFTKAGLVERPGDVSADLVADVHGIAHEPALGRPLAAHAQRIAPGGRLVLEFHHLLPMLEQSQIDTVRHGHFVYLSLIAMDRLLRRHDLVPTRAMPVEVFGGSLRLTAARAVDDPAVDASVARVLAAERAAGLDGPEAVVSFGERGRRNARAFAEHLRSLRDSGRSVAGYGAPSKAPVLLALAGVDDSLLPYTVDLAPAKHGRRLPGTGIPILRPDELLARRPDEVAVLTWDIADEIVAQLARAASGSDWSPRLYAPLPAARYLAELRAPA
jgi:hypothetical protein